MSDYTSDTYQITTHLPNSEEPNGLQIEAQGEPSPGGARSTYLVTWPNRHNIRQGLWLDFQPGRGGGLTNEVLLAIVIDRLEAFDKGPFPSAENLKALESCRWALRHLHERTLARRARGVEGLQRA